MARVGVGLLSCVLRNGGGIACVEGEVFFFR